MRSLVRDKCSLIEMTETCCQIGERLFYDCRHVFTMVTNTKYRVRKVTSHVLLRVMLYGG